MEQEQGGREHRGGGGPRYRNVSGRPLDRRVVLKAAAGWSALAVTDGIGSGAGPGARAQESQAGSSGTGTRAERYVPGANEGGLRTASADDFTTFQADFPFTAIGASWAGDVGQWPVIEMMMSGDGENWSETYALSAFPEDGGQPNREGRLFTPLLFGDGAQWVRYRAVDMDGKPGEVADMSMVYIDATGGPSEPDIAGADISTAAVDPRTPPPIITRAEWGANENYRFDDFGEIWPPEYETVRKVIVHHTATSNTQDSVAAIRAIYYYHAVEQGWGDIGYNYLVDRAGRIYQGRVGGQNVIGGHSFQYAVGSSGISAIGDFTYQDATPSAQAGLAAIVAFVGRDLDPYGRSSFLEAPNLPNICAHRDVNQTSCPGNRLYADLPQIRDAVAAALDELDTGRPGGIIPGDRVKVQTDDGRPLNVRSAPGTSSRVVTTLTNGSYAAVKDGAVERSDGNWYLVAASGGRQGWVTAQFLIVTPVPPPGGAGDFAYGLNVLFNSEANVRRSPTTSAGVIAVVPRGTWAFILAGPTDSNGYEWYQIRTQSIRDGWTIKSNLTPNAIGSAVRPRFAVGNTVEATSSLSIRARPGVAQTSIATVGAGTRFKISQTPVRVTGGNWYGVYSAAFGGGWVPESALRLISTTPQQPGTNKFRIGDRMRVRERLNLRSTPSTSGSLIASMPAGTTGTVTAGPRTANGYVWWQVRTSYGTGWAVQDWMERTGGGTTPPPTGGIARGDTVQVINGNLNLRTSPDSSASIIRVLREGTRLNVYEGPRSADGYQWYRVNETGTRSGWVVGQFLREV